MTSFCREISTKTFKKMDIRFRLTFSHEIRDFVLDVNTNDNVSETFARVEQNFNFPRESLKFSLDGEALDESLSVCETEIIAESIIDVEMRESYIEYLETREVVPEFKNIRYILDDLETKKEIEKIVKTYSSWNFYYYHDYFSANAKTLVSETLLRETFEYSNKKYYERLAALVRLVSAYGWHPFLISILSEVTQTQTFDVILENVPEDVLHELSFDSNMMVEYVEYGYKTLVETFLKAGSNPNSCRDGKPAIVVATEKQRLEIIKLLLEYGANIDAKTDKGHTSLMISSEIGDENIVKFFLDSGADINAVDHYDRNALKFAIKSCKINVVREIIKREPILSDESRSPLYEAISCGCINIAMLCFEYKQYKENDLFHFLMKLFRANCLEKFGKVLDKIDQKEIKYYDDQLLIILIQEGKHEYEYVSCLLNHGFNINVYDGLSKSAILYALDKGGIIVDLILECGQTLKLDEKIFNNLDRHDDIEKYFSDGYDFDKIFDDGTTLLTSVTFQEQDNSYYDSDGSESEHNPEPEENIEYVDFLIKRCDPNLRSRDGVSPAEYAANNNMPYLFRKLKEKDVCIDLSKIEIKNIENFEIIKHLIGLGLEICEEMNKVLAIVLRKNDYTTAKIILARVPKFLVSERIYRLAASSRDRELVNALLDHDLKVKE